MDPSTFKPKDPTTSTEALNDDDLRSMFSSILRMMSTLHNWGTKIDQFGQELGQLRSSIKDVDSRIHAEEQYSKNYNLLIHNLPNIPKHRHGLDFNCYVADEINKMPLMKHLPLTTTLGRHQIIPDDLDISHIYKTKQKKTVPSVVIVRFKSRALRNEIYKAKKTLKGYRNPATGKPITITEHLTSRNMSLFKHAQNTLGYSNVWTLEGRITGLVNGDKTPLHNANDVSNAKRKIDSNLNSNLDFDDTSKYPPPE